MKWLGQLLILLMITFFGEAMRYLIPLAIPAGIYGLALLFLLLCTGVIRLSRIERAADFLVEAMPLFFIPAGVGLMTKWAELRTMFLPFLIAVTVITAVVAAVTGWVSQALIRRGGRSEDA